MTTGDALLRAILTEPEEDTPRLVYADWLDENGQGERATYIRTAVEIAQTLMVCEDAGTVLSHDGGATLFVSRCRCRPCSLARREYNASKRHIVWDWCGGVGGGWAHMVRTTSWRRGFAAEIHCTQPDFLAHAESIFRSHPVDRVTLSDREPAPGHEEGWHWFANDRRDDEVTIMSGQHKLLWPLAKHLTGSVMDYYPDWSGLPYLQRLWFYPTDDAARLDLSAACVAYGRELAGLPNIFSNPSARSAPVGRQ